MKVTVKTLAQKSFTVEVEPSDVVKKIKEAIHASQGFEVETQKLIYSGKILDDSKTVEECGIEEKGFLVVMTAKPKATPAVSSSSSTTTSAAAPAPASVPVAPAPAAPAAVPSTPVTLGGDTAAEATPASTAFDASTLATGSNYENAVQGLIEMGFERTEVVRAMRAAFNNPDRAAEYLMTGIPEQIVREMAGSQSAGQQPSPAGQQVAQPTQQSTQQQGEFINLFDAAAQAQQQQPGTPGVPSAGGANPADIQNQLAFLRNSPQFQQLRQLIQTQPHLIQPLLQQLAQSNPQLMQLISQNQDQFFQLLGEGVEGAEGLLGAGTEGAEGVEGAPPGAQYISVTPEEEEAINRLVGLGFDRALAIEAFFACDKNEELAANYLFDHGAGDEWQ
ncbi:hypothetical protein HDU85_006729 [Gaertneriomyces sp. JEL0708]|nr:hypothetical protein HDU85_006729 [Gaertneriomyces sp. JEL0708]